MTTVLAHGVFDVLHPGHIAHLKEARAMGDKLVVGITTDQYVNKGPGHPVYSHARRRAQVAALDVVDQVIFSHDATGCGLLRDVRPDIFVKGVDYEGVDIPEKRTAEELGIEFRTTTAPKESVFANVERKLFHVYPEETERWLEGFRKHHSADEVLGALDSIAEMNVLVVGEYIVDRYTFVDTLAKSPREHHMSVKVLRTENYAGGSVAIRRHLKGFVGKTHVVAQQEGIVKERFVENGELRKMFSVQHLPDELTISDASLTRLDNCGNYDLVVAADYGHGVFTHVIRHAVEQQAKFLAVNCQTNSANYGFNLATKWARADYLTMDGPEQALAGVPSVHISDMQMITNGKDGVALNGIYVPALATKVVDRVGAGDALFALTAPLVAAKVEPEITAFIGSCAAAMQCETVGNEKSVDPKVLRKFIQRLMA